MVFVFVFTAFCSAQAYSFDEAKTNKERVFKELDDGNGRLFILVENGEKGYYIFDQISGKCLEYSEDAPSPYLNKFENLYYFGPFNYYEKEDETFTHTITKVAIEKKMQICKIIGKHLTQH